VQRLDGGMVEADGRGLGVGQGKLELAGETIDTHELSFLQKAGRSAELLL
jgi:hypothetical protein